MGVANPGVCEGREFGLNGNCDIDIGIFKQKKLYKNISKLICNTF